VLDCFYIIALCMDLCMLLSFSRNYGVLEFSHKSSGGIKGLPSES